MKVLKIKLEVLTHMFSSGSNCAEFRVTELKALMRSTFRELYEFKDIDDMREKEGELFGRTPDKNDSDESKKRIKSPIAIRTEKVIRDKISLENMLPHKKGNGKTQCIKASTEVLVEIISNNSGDLDIYIEILILSSVIGALGKRSRKGFGSFRVSEIKGDSSSNYEKYNELLKSSPLDIFMEFKEKSENRKHEIRNFAKNIDENILEFDNLECGLNFPYVTKINIVELKDNSYTDILYKVSELTHKRLGDNFENNNDVKYILGNWSGKMNRFASPIYVSISQHSNISYLIIKELNYNYILTSHDMRAIDKQECLDYVNKYVKELKEIGEGKSK